MAAAAPAWTTSPKAAAAPAEQPLDMPLTLEPYRHENEQFGYLPDYPVENLPGDFVQGVDRQLDKAIEIGLSL